MSFKQYVINEENNQLGHRLGDVLTAMQELEQDLPNLSQRHLLRLTEQLVGELRKILHSQWSQKSFKSLKEVQKVAVAIQKAIEDKGDLKELIPIASQALQQLSSKLGVKVNDLKAPEQEAGGVPVTQDDFELTGEKPEPQPDQGQQPPMDPNQQPPMPQQQMPPQQG